MTPVAIAFFKHFLLDQRLGKFFVKNYNHYKCRTNPDSIEEYLLEADTANPLLKAFYFRPNGTPSFDYWKDANDKWCKYWDLCKDNVANNNWMFLKGSFAILRQNWDFYSHSPKIESFEETYKRMSISSPYDETDESNADAKKSVEKVAETWKKEDDLLDGFEFNICVDRKAGRRIDDNQIVISNGNRNWRVTFSILLSELIVNSKRTHVRLATKSATGELAMDFGDKGINLANLVQSRDRKNVNINSKEVVNSIVKFYNIPPSVKRIKLTNTEIINTSDKFIMIFKYEY